jgi:hypothetical protein
MTARLRAQLTASGIVATVLTANVLISQSIASVSAAQSTAAAASQISDASALERRALAYWERRKAKDLDGAYPFYCAAYRERVPLSQFLQMTRLVRFDFLELRIAKLEGSGDQAQVTIAYKFFAPMLAGQIIDASSMEVWIRGTDTEWCKEAEPLVLPFPSNPSQAPVNPGR